MLQCKTKHYTPYEFEGKQLIFGTGGGFTGQVKEYTLLENGQLFSGAHQEGFVKELPKVKKNKTKQIFENYHSLHFDKITIDKPGNMYHYLIVKEGEKEHKIQWGAYDANPPRELTVFFANINKLASDLNKSDNKLIEKK
jgi:hypothetical protein